jgi:hypothetical protein
MELIIEDWSHRPHKIEVNSDSPRSDTGRSWTWLLEQPVHRGRLRVIIEDGTITVIAGGRSPGGTSR